MSSIILSFIAGANFTLLLIIIPVLFLAYSKKIQAIVEATQHLKNTEELVELKEKIKELEDMNQRMSKYLDTVENRLQNLKSEG